MSSVRLVIRDIHRDIYSDCHASVADRTIAALSAEPETIAELNVALERFMVPEEGGFFRGFSKGIDDQPYDAGIVVVDLAARLIVCESSYLMAAKEGYVEYHNGKSATDIGVSYHLSDDWSIVGDARHWQPLADARRRQRLANPPLDARAVLYGKALLEYIARRCFEALVDRPLIGNVDDADANDIVRQIHAAWMTDPRDDLRGQAPRDVMLARQSHISRDLQDRSEQWSHQGRCPRGLDEQSAAYRFGGFGTHELVTYYDLVRFLLWSCFDELKPGATDSQHALADPVGMTTGDFLAIEVPRLAQLRNQWLNEPNMEFSGCVPSELIAHERARLPEGMSGHEAIIDCDCPLCQMQADLPGPVFWRLDGCNMDDEFAFSFHRTREEWEEEQRENEEFDRRFDARQAEITRLGVQCPGAGYSDPDEVWQSSFSSSALTEESCLMRLFAIGSHLAELIVDLKQPTEDRPLIDQLSRDFGNLREVAQSPDLETVTSLIEPVIHRFFDTLNTVAVEKPQLAAKCLDLQKRIDKFLEPPRTADDSDDEPGDWRLPF